MYSQKDKQCVDGCYQSANGLIVAHALRHMMLHIDGTNDLISFNMRLA